MKKHVRVIGVLTILIALATSAVAISVEHGNPAIAWEADLTSVAAAFPNSLVYVDHMVLAPGHNYQNGAGYLYLYQVENAGGVPIDAFSVTFDTTAPGLLGAGVLTGDDLDVASALHPAHTVGGEVEGFALASVAALLTTVDPNTVTWTFAPQAAGTETDTFFIWHLQPPVYGNAGAQDGSPPSPWASIAPGGTRVPVPNVRVPDSGTTILLLGAALTALGVVSRKLRK